MITLTATITLDDGTTISLNKKNLLSLNIKTVDRSDMVMPSWGIISNGGTLRFLDYDKTIKDLAQNLKLKSKTKVNIFLNNTVSKATMQVGEFFSERWNYDNNTNEVTLAITDGLKKMQDINIIPLEYNYSIGGAEHNNIQKIYDFLHLQTINNGFDMLSSSELDAETLSHLSGCGIRYPFIDEMTLWGAWQSLCEAFQLHIFKNRFGKIVCVYKGGD